MQKNKLIIHFLISLLVVAVFVAVFDYVVLQNLLQDEWGVAPYRITVPLPFAENLAIEQDSESKLIEILGAPHRSSGSGFSFFEWDLCFGKTLVARVRHTKLDYADNIVVTNARPNARWLIFPCLILCLSSLETFLYWKLRSKKRAKETSA